VTGPRPGQWFRFGPWTFAVHTAEDLIAAAPRATTSIDVAAWATAYGLTRIDNKTRRAVSLLGPAADGFDRTYAMTTDVTKPVIVAQLGTRRQPFPLLIDGTHRLYRGWREGHDHLPAYLLTLEESLQIRDDVLLGPNARPIRRPT
jgi:hypothetical protein